MKYCSYLFSLLLIFQVGVIVLDAIAKVIRDAKADLVAVQELDISADRSLNMFHT